MSRRTRSAAKKRPVVASDSDASDDDLVPIANHQLRPPDDNTLLSFQTQPSDAKPAAVAAPRQVQFATAADHSSSDDGADDLSLFDAPIKHTVTQLQTGSKIPVVASATTTTKDEAMRTKASILTDQQTRRSEARSVLDAIRNGDVPFYDSNRDDAAQTIVVDKTIFNALNTDSAREFQDANKPPWVPSLAPNMINKIRNWQVIEAVSELEQRKNPWYTMVLKVAGFLNLPEDQLVVYEQHSASSNAVQPTRNSVRGAFATGGGSGGGGAGGGGGASGGGGAGSGQRATGTSQGTLAMAPNATPAAGRLASFSADIPPLQVRPAGGPSAAGRTVPPTIDEQLAQIDEARVPTEAEFEDLLVRNTLETTLSKGRFRDLRDAKRETEWYELDLTKEAIEQNRLRRVEGAQAQVWIARPLATGIFYLSNIYVAARDDAYTQITSRADQLSQVPIEAFIAESANDNLQLRIRTQFAKLIATNYNLQRHNSNRSAKLAADAANLSGQAEDIIQWFVNRISYDEQSKRFFDTGAQGAVNMQPAWKRRALNTPTQYRPSLYGTSNNPLLARSPFQSATTMFSGAGRSGVPF